MYVDSVLDIPLDQLREAQIKALIFDLDNTVTEWNNREVRQDVEEWFGKLKAMGFAALILSNNSAARIADVAARLGVPFIHKARKPRRQSFYGAVRLLQVKPEEAAVIGDQIFTDILGGNRAGLFTILVKPLSKREFVGTKVSRALEFFVLPGLQRRLRREGTRY